MTLAAALLMVGFHLFIISTFPLAVPLEWNVVFAYTTVFLFLGFPNRDGYAPWNMSPPWLAARHRRRAAVLPDPGQSAAGQGVLPALAAAVRGQLGLGGVDLRAGCRAEAEPGHPLGVQPGRPVHRGRLRAASGRRSPCRRRSRGAPCTARVAACSRCCLTHLPDVDTRTVREGEFVCNSLIGFNFGDGHLHDEDLIRAVQRRSRHSSRASASSPGWSRRPSAAASSTTS